MNYNDSLTGRPTAQEYKSALMAIGCIPITYVAMLQAHYNAPNRIVTATELSNAVGYKGFPGANRHYARLGDLLSPYLNWHPNMPISTLVSFQHPGDEWEWIMHPEIAEALDQIQWIGCKSRKHMRAVPK